MVKQIHVLEQQFLFEKKTPPEEKHTPSEDLAMISEASATTQKKSKLENDRLSNSAKISVGNPDASNRRMRACMIPWRKKRFFFIFKREREKQKKKRLKESKLLNKHVTWLESCMDRVLELASGTSQERAVTKGIDKDHTFKKQES